MLEKNIIGKRIKFFRQVQGITQDQLAARINVQGIEIDQTMISKIEDQVRGIADYEIKALSIALEVSIEELFKESV